MIDRPDCAGMRTAHPAARESVGRIAVMMKIAAMTHIR
jgi:hypothetical protein